MLKIVEKQEDNRGNVSAGMLDTLLGRGDGVKLVQVHGFRIVKVTPVKVADNPCCDFVRGGTQWRPVENSAKLAQIFEKPFGEYMVTVCSGVIKDVARVAKEEQVREVDLQTENEKAVDDDEVMSADTIEAQRRKRGKANV